MIRRLISGVGSRKLGFAAWFLFLFSTSYFLLPTSGFSQTYTDVHALTLNDSTQYPCGIGAFKPPGYLPQAGGGLKLNLGPGSIGTATYSGGTLTMTASSTNHVYLDKAANYLPKTSVGAVASTNIPIATVITGISAITTVTDLRSVTTLQMSTSLAAIKANGTVDMTCYQNPLSFNSDIFSPVSKYVTVIMPPTTLTLNADTTIPSNFMLCYRSGSALTPGIGHSLTDNSTPCGPGGGGGEKATSCPANQFMTGEDASGNAICAAASATTTRVCNIVAGGDSAPILANTDIAPQSFQCDIPKTATVLEVDVRADTGTPSVIVGFITPVGVVSNLVSAPLATAGSGGKACANAAGGLGVDGVTTCSATLQNATVAIGSYFETISATAGGAAHLHTVSVIFTMTN